MKYKVRDRVKVKNEFDIYEEYRDKQFVIEECDSSDDTYLCHPITGGYRIWFSEENLEPIAPTLAEIKEKKLCCVIKVDSKEEAIKLFEIFNSNRYDANYAYDYLMVNYWKGDGTVCFSVVGNKINGFDTETYYEKNEEQYGKIYRLKDLFAEGGGVALKPREESVSFTSAPYLDLSSFILPTNSRAFEERLNEELAKHFNAFPNDGISAKNGGKNSMKFTFYVTEGTRIDKTCNKTIPTITTHVEVCGFDDWLYRGTATCDKVDYSERQGVLEAFANAMLGDNFERNYNKAIKWNKSRDLFDRTCSYCGQVFDTIEDRKAHEDWHVECRKARHERYLLRKRAKEIAFEEAAQKLAKEIIAEGNKK